MLLYAQDDIFFAVSTGTLSVSSALVYCLAFISLPPRPLPPSDA